MRIVLSGVETNNKGAELMLYAILQEIERRWPDAEVFIPNTYFKQGLSYIETPLKVKFWPYDRFLRLVRGIVGRLHIATSCLQNTFVVRNADYFLDASGFHFSDQKKNFTPAKVKRWNIILKKYRSQGTKIVFLPQAFGPVSKQNTLNGLRCISQYADLIMPREQISYDYLEESGVMDMNKVVLNTDFTSLVEGKFPDSYSHLRGGICIIPNMKMIDTGACSLESYIELISIVVESVLPLGRPIYILNHEGIKDEKLAYICKAKIKGVNEDVVTGLKALEVKGLISSAYLVVSSRFHGVASSLNSCVPCLATSWSHKYQELFKDYGLVNCVLPITDIPEAKKMVRKFSDDEYNTKIRNILSVNVAKIKEKTNDMWKMVWERN